MRFESPSTSSYWPPARARPPPAEAFPAMECFCLAQSSQEELVMRNPLLIRLLPCAACLAMYFAAAPLAAQNRSDEERDSNRSQQTRERDNQDDQDNRGQSQQR